jgi:DNA-binding NarL/FixJ family response regulator
MAIIICFIDDSHFEHSLVNEIIAPSEPDLTFVQAYTFKEAMEKLGDRKPHIFLLDLWGQDKSLTNPTIPSREEVEDRIAEIRTIKSVYEGLEGYPHDKFNEYLKRLFSIVHGWRQLFEDVCAMIGQNRKYGLENLRLAREAFPSVPVLFYTRKSLISDAVALFQAGADGLFIKPTGRDDEETRESTKANTPNLIVEILRILDQPNGCPSSISDHSRPASNREWALQISVLKQKWIARSNDEEI